MRIGVVFMFWRVIVLAAIVFSTSSTALGSPRLSRWQLASDFLTAPRQSNPNPDRYGHPLAWEFLQAPVLHDPSSYSLLREFIPDAFGVDGLEQWQGPSVSTGTLDKLPAVGINATGAVQFPSTISWPANMIRAHPLSNDAVAVGWRSPVAGYLRVSVGLSDLDANCGDGVGWFVDKGGATLAAGQIPNGGRGRVSLNVHVDEGIVLYFIVTDGGRGDDSCDSTGLSVAIQRGLAPAQVTIRGIRATPLSPRCATEIGVREREVRAVIADAVCRHFRLSASGVIRVGGRLAPTARGLLTVTVTATLPRGPTMRTARTFVAGGRWRISLVLPGVNLDPLPPRYLIIVRYHGNHSLGPASTERRIRVESEPAGL